MRRLTILILVAALLIWTPLAAQGVAQATAPSVPIAPSLVSIEALMPEAPLSALDAEAPSVRAPFVTTPAQRRDAREDQLVARLPALRGRAPAALQVPVLPDAGREPSAPSRAPASAPESGAVAGAR